MPERPLLAPFIRNLLSGTLRAQDFASLSEGEPVVYFVQGDHGGPVKIGISHCGVRLKKRLGSLQTGHPRRLVIRGLLRGGAAEEFELHQALDHWRTQGEWFEPFGEFAGLVGALPLTDAVETDLWTVYNAGHDEGYQGGREDGAFHHAEVMAGLLVHLLAADDSVRTAALWQLAASHPDDLREALEGVQLRREEAA